MSRAGGNMQAMVYERYGPPEVLRLREVAKPVPGAGEVLIRIVASVATPPDCAFRSGRPFVARLFTGLLRPRFRILGGSLAGVVEAVGDGVARFRPGDRVFGASDGSGCYAGYICLSEPAALAKLPTEMDFGDAVALAEGFLTALPFLRDEARIRAGQRVLVNGASGSIGTTAVQLAKHFGAEVTAVCSGAKAGMVRSLGADRIIDYTAENFTRAGERWDIIFDTVGKSSFADCRRALSPSGVYLTTVPTLACALQTLRTRNSPRQRAVFATTGLRPADAKAADLELLRELVEAGRLRAVIDRRLPLADLAAAHRYVETGRKRGSVVIAIADAAEGA
jgi:NADPH:quinone reductase-like Zn-dependent oxidoreductase